MTGEDYRSVDAGIGRRCREDRYRKGALRAAYDSKVTHRGGENYNADGTARPVLYTTWAARDDGLLPRNLGYTIEADDVGRWTLQGLVDAHAKPKAKTKRRKRR